MQLPIRTKEMYNEKKRIEALKEYDILDSEREKDFDDIVELASTLLDIPISLITLVNTSRQWFKASYGVEITETPIELSICNHAINDSDVMVVEDLSKDERFSENPLVTDNPKIQFYAGAPLIDPKGNPLGTLCVIDTKARGFSDKEKKCLTLLASRVMNLLELRKENLEQKEKLKKQEEDLNELLYRFIEAQHTAKIGSWDWDLTTDSLYWSPEMYTLYNLPKNQKNLIKAWQSKVHQSDLRAVLDSISLSMREGFPNTIEHRILHDDGSLTWVETRGSVELDKKGQSIRLSGTSQDITERKKAEADKIQYVKTLEKIMFDFSHKVRQPLTNWMGIVQQVDLSNSTPENTKLFTDYLRSSTKTFDDLVRDMSEFVHRKKRKIG